MKMTHIIWFEFNLPPKNCEFFLTVVTEYKNMNTLRCKNRALNCFVNVAPTQETVTGLPSSLLKVS